MQTPRIGSDIILNSTMAWVSRRRETVTNCTGVTTFAEDALYCHHTEYKTLQYVTFAVAGVFLVLGTINLALIVRMYGWDGLNKNVRTQTHWIIALHVVVGMRYVRVRVWHSVEVCCVHVVI